MNKQKEQDIQFQIECLTNDLIIMLMDDDGMSMEQALDTVYSSNTYKKLKEPVQVCTIKEQSMQWTC